MVEIFRARYEHHLTNMVIGLCKYHFIVGQKADVVIDDYDYEVAEQLFNTVIGSWNKHNIQDLPNNVKLRVIPINAKIVYDIINTVDKKRVGINDVHSLTKYIDLPVTTINTWIAYLNKVGLLKVIDYAGGKYYAPEWYKEDLNENRNK